MQIKKNILKYNLTYIAAWFYNRFMGNDVDSRCLNIKINFGGKNNDTFIRFQGKQQETGEHEW